MLVTRNGTQELGAAGREIVVPAPDRMAAVIEEAFLVLAQAVVVLIVGRGEGGADGVEFRIGGTAVVDDVGRAVLVVGHGL